MTTNFTEPYHAGEFIVSEANGNLSRETVTITGAAMTAGMVLGTITVGAASSAAAAGNTGNGAMGAVTVSAGAKPGVYTLTVIEPGTDAGDFIVEDPNGVQIGSGSVASAFSAGGLAFTLADGSTDFAAGDVITITVAEGSGKYVQFDQDGADGRQHAAGILFRDADASASDVQALAVVRLAEVKAAYLVWPSDIDGGEKTAALAELAALNIIAR